MKCLVWFLGDVALLSYNYMIFWHSHMIVSYYSERAHKHHVISLQYFRVLTDYDVTRNILLGKIPRRIAGMVNPHFSHMNICQWTSIKMNVKASVNLLVDRGAACRTRRWKLWLEWKGKDPILLSPCITSEVSVIEKDCESLSCRVSNWAGSIWRSPGSHRGGFKRHHMMCINHSTETLLPSFVLQLHF